MRAGEGAGGEIYTPSRYCKKRKLDNNDKKGRGSKGKHNSHSQHSDDGTHEDISLDDFSLELEYSDAEGGSDMHSNNNSNSNIEDHDQSHSMINGVKRYE